MFFLDLKKKKTSATMRPKPAMPPTVPPAIAPTWDFFEPEDDEVGGGSAAPPVVDVGASDDVVLGAPDAEVLDSSDEGELVVVGSSELLVVLEVVLSTEVVGSAVPVKTTWRVLSLGMSGNDVNTVAVAPGLPQPIWVKPIG